jgi:hypothetical protein
MVDVDTSFKRVECKVLDWIILAQHRIQEMYTYFVKNLINVRSQPVHCTAAHREWR